MDERQERTIYIRNIDERVTEQLLREMFIQCGPIESVNVKEAHKGPDGKPTGRSRFAFVEFSDEESVLFACKVMDAIELFGQKIKVQPRDKTVQQNIYIQMGLNIESTKLHRGYVDNNRRRSAPEDDRRRRSDTAPTTEDPMLMQPTGRGAPPPQLFNFPPPPPLSLNFPPPPISQLETYGDRPRPIEDTATVSSQQFAAVPYHHQFVRPSEVSVRRHGSDGWVQQKPSSSNQMHNLALNEGGGGPICPPPPPPPTFYERRAMRVAEELAQNGGRYQGHPPPQYSEQQPNQHYRRKHQFFQSPPKANNNRREENRRRSRSPYGQQQRQNVPPYHRNTNTAYQQGRDERSPKRRWEEGRQQNRR